MATATRTKKQRSAIKDVKLKEGWKPMKDFGRYAFYKNGKVVNRATGNEIIASVVTTAGKFFQLTDDKGKRQRVSTEDVKNLFKEQKPAPAAKPAVPVNNSPVTATEGGSRGKSKLDYATAMDIRRRLAKGEKRGALATEYKVDPWTIQAIAINYSYRIKEGDENPIPAEMMEQFTTSNLPEAWKGKSREEIRKLAGFKYTGK